MSIKTAWIAYILPVVQYCLRYWINILYWIMDAQIKHKRGRSNCLSREASFARFRNDGGCPLVTWGVQRYVLRNVRPVFFQFGWRTDIHIVKLEASAMKRYVLVWNKINQTRIIAEIIIAVCDVNVTLLNVVYIVIVYGIYFYFFSRFKFRQSCWGLNVLRHLSFSYHSRVVWARPSSTKNTRSVGKWS